MSSGAPNYSTPRYGSYNTFLGFSNWLRLFNDNPIPATITVTVAELGNASPATPLGSTSIVLQPFSGVDAELISTLGLSIPADTYGTVKVESTINGVFAEMLRLKDLNGVIDIAASSPVR